MFQIRKSKNEDLFTVISMIECAKINMARSGINQWQNGTPNADLILEDIVNGESYVLIKEGEIVASAMVSLRPEPTYNSIDGAWHKEDDYCVIHRFVVSDKYNGQGIGKSFLKLIEDQMDSTLFRIDTHATNLGMRGLLEGQNYEFCGIITLKDGSKRVAYDKIVK